MAKRVFLVVLDSLGIGNAPDADKWNDEGSNTLAAVCSHSNDAFNNLASLGLFDIDGHKDERISNWVKAQNSMPSPKGSYARIRELSAGKDSTIGHWEMAGVYSDKAQPTYPNGFPESIINSLREITGRDILCNKPYSGTEVIKDYGDEHVKTGALIVYTSADSVLQIAAHEDVVPLETLYDYCSKARDLMCGEHAVGRIIARPFTGTSGNYTRTANRHDYALSAPASTLPDILKAEGLDVISIGKIKDLFAGRGFTEMIATKDNTDGISKLEEYIDKDFNGLCFVNLVDFDMKYGHRNDIPGYAGALHEFDDALGRIIPLLRPDDLLIVTADHGCDPSTASTDHSRECVPLLMYGCGHDVPYNMGYKAGFGIVAASVYDALLAPAIPHDFAPACGANVPDENNIMSYVDMTNLKVTATEEDIKTLVDNAAAAGAASVCVQPCYVRLASEHSRGRVAVCTVIGFPNGYNTTAVKKYETIDAINNGASEIDMVINVAFVKSRNFEQVADEIGILANTCHEHGAILKVIIETCNLTETEKKALCQIVTVQGADFIKTSTGFGSAGATVEDVALMRRYCGSNVRIKAAGGIRSKESAKAMLDAGACRIGASSLG